MRQSVTRIAALVLAAGYSSRMGKFKPLLSFGNSTVIERAISSFLEAGVADVKVVVGWKADELVPLLDLINIRAILNPHYDSGMYSSVVAGVNSLGPDIEAFFMLPADYPLVKPQTVQQLIQRFAEGNVSVVYPRHNQQRGHPPLISTSCIDRSSNYDLPGGLRTVLRKYAGSAVDVDVCDEGILLDVDTPEDYEKALAYFSR